MHIVIPFRLREPTKPTDKYKEYKPYRKYLDGRYWVSVSRFVEIDNLRLGYPENFFTYREWQGTAIKQKIDRQGYDVRGLLIRTRPKIKWRIAQLEYLWH